ncbi:MAG: hypothetical protein HWN80_13060 [Candidatus Lokiarchaeota archaeon]|nr:hypothetical protein [Candidatus Lokiarchaeota archaeon]
MSKSTEKYARINLILSREDKEKWDIIAGDLLGISLSQLIRDAVNDYIGRLEHYERIIKKDSFERVLEVLEPEIDKLIRDKIDRHFAQKKG